MAEEAAEKSGDGGSVLKKWGPLAAIVLIAQVTVAWVLITTVFKDKVGGKEPPEELLPGETQIEEGGSKEKHSGKLPYYLSPPQLKKITANPAGTNASRFVVVSVDLGLIDEKGGDIPPDSPDLPKLEPYVGLAKSIIIDVIRAKTVDELTTPEYVSEIQKEIREKLNSRIMARVFAGKEDEELKLRVEEVLFTEFIIQ